MCRPPSPLYTNRHKCTIGGTPPKNIKNVILIAHFVLLAAVRPVFCRNPTHDRSRCQNAGAHVDLDLAGWGRNTFTRQKGGVEWGGGNGKVPGLLMVNPLSDIIPVSAAHTCCTLAAEQAAEHSKMYQ